MQMEGCRDCGRGSMPRPHTHSREGSAEDERFGVHGISQGKEQFDVLSEMGEYEICVPKPRILVPWILRRYGRQEYGKDKRIHSQPTQTR